MQPANRYALKEWAVVCAALEQGRQTLLLRKGGIAEGPDGFVVEHPEFWLFPTRFHQSAEELVEEAAPLLEAVSEPPQGVVRLSLYATVELVAVLGDESQLMRLTGRHILSPETALSRFHYRSPGLSVLALRVYRLPAPIVIPDAPHFAGCHSWVDLDGELPTDRLEPVLPDADFARQLAVLRRLLGNGSD